MLMITVMLIITALCAFDLGGESRNLFRYDTQNKGTAGAFSAEVQAAETPVQEELYAGLQGVIASAVTMREYSEAASIIETAGANEEVLVGASHVSRSESLRKAMTEGTRSAGNVVSSARALIRQNQMASSEYYTLLQIVEAEATGEDLKGKMLIANVILNRVKDDRFPNTIEEVVWQTEGGSAQFQPTIDGRIYSVEVTDETIQAVDRVLAGEDESRGALFFMARSASESVSVGWFDTNLTPLFKHGGHEYYTLS
ncbi:MAG: cell wall hydrolase [Eubacteriales bacterium]|nr:cell wall hydrolase [Eubacteriales bacterium]